MMGVSKSAVNHRYAPDSPFPRPTPVARRFLNEAIQLPVEIQTVENLHLI